MTISMLNTGLLILAIILLLYKRLAPLRVFRILRGSADEGQIHDESIVKGYELAPIAYVTTDKDGNIKAWNNKATEFYGLKESEVLQRKFIEYIPHNFVQLFEASKIIDNGIPIEMEAVNIKTNNKITIQCTTWKWFELSKERFFYTSILMDISHRKANEQMKAQIEESLRALKELYLEGEKIDQSGIWKWDVINDIVYPTQGFNEIFDTDSSDHGPAAYFMRRVHGQDREKVKQAIDNCFATKKGYEIDYRVIGRDAAVTWVYSRTRTYLDSDGNLKYIIGIARVTKKEGYGSVDTMGTISD